MGSIRRKGKRWYYRYYDPSGKRREIALHTTDRKIAERLAEIYDRQLEDSKNPELLANATFAEVLHLYLDFISPQKSPSTMKDYQTIAHRLEEFFGNFKISRIKEFHIVRQLQEMEERGYAVESRRKTLMLLRQVMRFAKKRGYIIDDPTEGIKIHRDKRPNRLRWFTEEELKTIFRKAQELYPRIAHIYRFLYYTGLRRSELIALKWSDIDLKRKVIKIQDSKSPEGYRRIPLREEAIEIVRSLPRLSEWVFVNPDTALPWDASFLSKSFKKVLKACGITDASLHTLRHTFASHLAMAGVSLDVIRDLLGHSSVQITEIYAHLAPDYVRDAVKKLPTVD
ncbi:tyrosine-type recombinase/integrase [bacterium]|nr:tyrosine-type recombinase/integrase [bacterium]